jgi:hypothetical protein
MPPAQERHWFSSMGIDSSTEAFRCNSSAEYRQGSGKKNFRKGFFCCWQTIRTDTGVHVVAYKQAERPYQ